MTKRNKRPTTVYLDPQQLKALAALSKRTGVPAAVYIRRGVELVFKNLDCGGNTNRHATLYGDFGQHCPTCIGASDERAASVLRGEFKRKYPR